MEIRDKAKEMIDFEINEIKLCFSDSYHPMIFRLACSIVRRKIQFALSIDGVSEKAHHDLQLISDHVWLLSQKK